MRLVNEMDFMFLVRLENVFVLEAAYRLSPVTRLNCFQ